MENALQDSQGIYDFSIEQKFYDDTIRNKPERTRLEKLGICITQLPYLAYIYIYCKNFNKQEYNLFCQSQILVKKLKENRPAYESISRFKDNYLG